MNNFNFGNKLHYLVANWPRHLPIVASILLIVLVAQSAASLTWKLVAPSAAIPAVSSTQTSTGPLSTKTRSEREQLLRQGLFGTETVSPVNAGIDAPETQLNLVLRGLLAGETDQTSRAIISNGDDEKTYSVGDTIAAGITVHAILADRVIISRRGTLESVRLPRESGILGNNTSSVASGYSAVPLGTGSEIAASSINAVATLTEIVRPIPVSRNGKQIGFRVYPGRARKKFVELGLQAGDIVTAINNISLDDPAMGVQAFENLGNQSSITLSLIRDGQEQQLVLQTGR
ncbi:MAG: type II secretion system protein GspC [Gammaproteobacteria bacterium]